jgi:hypothetical protein
MDINLVHLFNLIIKYLSVGNILQNTLFYGLIVLLLSINLLLIKRKHIGSRKLPQDLDSMPQNNSFVPICVPTDEGLLKQNIQLHGDVEKLKGELLALGKELELSYNKSDKLNDQLSDILNCLDLTISYDEHLCAWSIEFFSQELSLSDYGFRIHGFPLGTKPAWTEFLKIVNSEYRGQIETAINTSITTGSDFSMYYKITPLDGAREKWIRSFGKVIYNGEGDPIRLDGKFRIIPSSQVIL